MLRTFKSFGDVTFYLRKLRSPIDLSIKAVEISGTLFLVECDGGVKRSPTLSLPFSDTRLEAEIAMLQDPCPLPTMEELAQKPTIVIFRKYNDGDIIAIFPEVPGAAPYLCMSYMHVGQHGDCDVAALIDSTKKATPEEFAALKTELESIGYVLDCKQKYNHRYTVNRQKEAAHARN
jgi:hypothetical protein